MDCRELDNLLYPYLDAELVEADRARVDAHLAACDGCRETTSRERAMLNVIRTRAKQQAAAPAPAALRARLTAELNDDANRQRRRSFTRVTAAAAGIAVCAVAAHHLYRVNQRKQYIENAALQHQRNFPMEISNRPTPAQLEAFFDGKLDHRVAVPRLPPNVTARGGRFLNVRDRQAATIELVGDRGRRMTLFVYGDKAGEVDVTEPEVDTSQGFNVVSWREGDVVYQLVTDPEEQDIREMLPRQGMGPPQILPASFHQ